MEEVADINVLTHKLLKRFITSDYGGPQDKLLAIRALLDVYDKDALAVRSAIANFRPGGKRA